MAFIHPIAKHAQTRPIFASFLVMCGAFLCCTACEDKPGADALEYEKNRGFVAFVGAGPSDPLFPVLRAGAMRFVASGTPMRVQFYNPATDSPKAQIELLAGLKDPDLRGLCIQPTDAEALAPVLEQLHRHGLSIVSMMKPAPEPIRAAHVSVDDIEIGRELARCVIEALGPEGGSIMVLHAGDRAPRLGLRHLTLMEELRRQRRVEVLADLDCENDAARAARIVQERMRRYPRLNAWVAVHDWLGETGQPLDDLLVADTKYVTFGGTPLQWPMVRNGRCPALVVADYGMIGWRAVHFCISAVRDPAQDKHLVFAPLQCLKRDNLDAYARQWDEWLSVASQPEAGQ